MSSGTRVTDYFNCPNCDARYSVTREQVPEQLSGEFDCQECGKQVHKWTGPFRFYDWTPIAMRTNGGR